MSMVEALVRDPLRLLYEHILRLFPPAERGAATSVREATHHDVCNRGFFR